MVVLVSQGTTDDLKSLSKKLYPPGPSGLTSLKDPSGEEMSQFQMLDRLREKYGDVFQYRTLAGTLCVFIHPDDIKCVFQRLNFERTQLLSLVLGEGVLAADNEHWKRQRQLILPVFRRPNIAKFTTLIAETTREHLEQWGAHVTSRDPIDVVNVMSRLTLSIVSKAMFSIDMGKEASSFLDAFNVAIKHLGGIANTTSFNTTMLISPETNHQFQQALEEMDSVVYSIIRKRRKSNARPEDLLTLLLDAVDADTGQLLTEVQIRDEVVTMLLAGHETTSLGLTWVWYLLGRYPEVEDRLGKEIDQHLAGRMVKYEDLGTLKYSRMVVEETMRLYPPVAVIWRQLQVEVEVAGYTIPRNTGIIVTLFLTHRHPDFWPDPLVFDPDRFDPETAPRRHSFAYFPFGGGRHVCLGKHFAMLESQVILITILQHYRIRPLDTHSAIPHFCITLRPKNGLHCVLERYCSDRTR